MEKLISFFFPSKCLVCGSVGDVVCDTCLKSSKLIGRRYLIDKDNSTVYCLFEYCGCVRDCIRYSKYASKMFHALRFITLWGVALSNPPKYEDFIVVPIPLSKRRISDRGFNQSEIIAKVLADKFGLSLDSHVLKRSKETVPQYTLGRFDRIKNVENAFEVKKEVKDKNILLVDDICTSGSTFLSAKKVLQKCGAKKIELFALSKKL